MQNLVTFISFIKNLQMMFPICSAVNSFIFMYVHIDGLYKWCSYLYVHTYTALLMFNLGGR